MRLLIVTQKIDKNDPILGFFVRWVEEFAKHCEQITVICLEEGEHDLPQNVAVHSLGKENLSPKTYHLKPFAKLGYMWRFYRYIFQFRKDYDSVFVHMNQEYILLGGIFWKLFGKRVFMWRNHHQGNVLTRIAIIMCDKVFCTSRFSYTAKYKKTVLMPVGIDATIFRAIPEVERKENSILFIGRISPSKRLHIFIEALSELKKKGFTFSVSIIGDPLPKDMYYYQGIKKQSQELGIFEEIRFLPGVPNVEAARIYNEHEVCVNMSSSGMYDKTIFEAALCGALSLSSNQNLKEIVDPVLTFKELNVEDLTSKLEELISLSQPEKTRIIDNFSRFILDNHSLKKLGEKLMRELQ